MQLKKPRFWDYKRPNLLSWILWPLSKIIELFNYISRKKIRNKLKIKTICVGNIYLGGTSKTSLAITINDILKKNKISCCFIKKFYSDQYDEQTILNKYGKVFLSKKRLESLKIAEKKNYKFAIFDDGLQDYSINYDLSFVCFNTINWIGNGMVIPSGPLRENIKNLRYYNYIFLNGNLENIELIKKDIYTLNPDIEIIVGKYIPINLNEFNLNEKYLAFSGIGNHASFISMLKSYKFNILKNIEYPDHYHYSKKDIDGLIQISKQHGCKIITTEKDFIRMKKHKVTKIKYVKSKLKILDEKKLTNAILKIYEIY